MNADELIELCFGRPHAWHLAEAFEVTHNGATLAHMETGIREILINGIPTPMAQVAWVCTDPRWRGQGFATRLLRAVASWGAGEGAPFVGLFADIPRFYEREGYQQTPNLGDYGMVAPLLDSLWPLGATIDLQGDVW